MRGNWGVREERERSHVCLCTQKLVFSSFRLSSEGLSHMKDFEESDSVSECAIRSDIL